MSADYFKSRFILKGYFPVAGIQVVSFYKIGLLFGWIIFCHLTSPSFCNSHIVRHVSKRTNSPHSPLHFATTDILLNLSDIGVVNPEGEIFMLSKSSTEFMSILYQFFKIGYGIGLVIICVAVIEIEKI